MTIINHYYKRSNAAVWETFLPQPFYSNKKYQPAQMKKRFYKKVAEIKNIFWGEKAASASALYLAIIVLAILLVGYLGLFTNITKLDYQIFTLKTDIQRLERENSDLKEKHVQNMSPESIKEWALKNGFAEAGEVSYFDVEFNPLVLNEQSNF